MSSDLNTNNRIKRFVSNPMLVSALIVLGYAFFVYNSSYIKVLYDEVVMQDMAAGVFGFNDNHLMFINYCLGYVTSSMYSLFTNINWLSLLLVGIIYFSVWFFLYRVIDLMVKKPLVYQMIIISGTLGIFNAIYYIDIVNVRFTCSAYIAGISTIIFCILIDRLNLIDVCVFVVLCVSCYALRDNTFKEIAPFLIIAVCYRFAKSKFKDWKIIISLFCVLVVLWGMKQINAVNYTDEYAHEITINSYRGAIVDFGGFPDYEDNIELYDGLGMEKLDFDVMQVSLGLSEFFNVETLSEIIKYKNSLKLADAEEQQKQFGQQLKKIVLEDYSVALWMLIGVLLAVAIVFSCYKKEYWSALMFLAFIAIGIAELIYLAKVGRTPTRVTKPVVAVLLLSSWCWFIKNIDLTGKYVKKIAIYFFIFTVCIISIFLSIKGFKTQSDAYEWFFRHDDEIQEYFISHPEYMYFTRGYDEKLNLFNPPKKNHIKLGGWVSETVNWRYAFYGEYDNALDALAYRQDLRLEIPEESIRVLEEYLNKKGYSVVAVGETVTLSDRDYYIWHFEQK